MSKSRLQNSLSLAPESALVSIMMSEGLSADAILVELYAEAELVIKIAYTCFIRVLGMCAQRGTSARGLSGRIKRLTEVMHNGQ